MQPHPRSVIKKARARRVMSVRIYEGADLEQETSTRQGQTARAVDGPTL